MRQTTSRCATYPCHSTTLVSERGQQPQITRTRRPDHKGALQRTYGGVYSLRDLQVCLLKNSSRKGSHCHFNYQFTTGAIRSSQVTERAL